MTYRVEWAPVALRDLEELLEYIAEQDSFGAAKTLGERIVERASSLKAHPTRCRIVPELREIGVRDYRELILAPYRVVFRIRGKSVGIVGVLDGRRDLEELLLRRYLDE